MPSTDPDAGAPQPRCRAASGAVRDVLVDARPGSSARLALAARVRSHVVGETERRCWDGVIAVASSPAAA
ncbi:hypothetical protein ACFPM0_28100 [Pseudonocardia sulfidoxydans]|uniref:hypothetical protein n=1 Tax=Pseudonocardia sulfidoxydans TaxID=54011 RepID=UPI00361C3B7F